MNSGSLKRFGAFLASHRLSLIRLCRTIDTRNISRLDVLCDQVIDSIIVGGITGVSAYIYAGEAASFKAALLSFTLTFLIKMKEYRKIT